MYSPETAPIPSTGTTGHRKKSKAFLGKCGVPEITYSDPAPVNDEEIEDILSGLANVAEWKEPVKKGRRVYDDSEF